MENSVNKQVNAAKKTLEIVFSGNIWTPAFVACGLWLTFYKLPAWLLPEHVLIAGLVVAVMCVAVVSLSSYSVEGVNDFSGDILTDVAMVVISTSSIAVMITGHYLANWSFNGIWFLLMALLVAMIDFVVSLYGGASKLLEMDKVNTAPQKLS